MSEPDQRSEVAQHPFWDRIRDEFAGRVAKGIVAAAFAALSVVLTPVREATWGRLPGLGDSGPPSSEGRSEPPSSEGPSEPPAGFDEEASDRYSGVVLGDFSVRRVSLGEAVSFGELHFTPRELTCGPEQVSAEPTVTPQGQTCRLSFDFRNDGKTRQGLALGDEFRLYVGDDFYDGYSRAAAAFPDAVGTGTASFYIPLGVAPSRLVFWHEDFDHDTETVVFEVIL